MPNRIMESSAPSETCNSRSFGRTRFEYWQQPSDFQRLPQVRAEITKLEASAFGFCLSMHFDECAEASAVNIVDVLQIDDNPCDAGRKEIVDHCTQPVALLSENKTTFERQKVDSIHLTLCYFQRHRLPFQGALRGFANASIIASGLPIPKARHWRAVQVDETGVSQAFVRRYFSKKEDPIGKRFDGDMGARTDGPQTSTIVGVIGDTKELGLASDTIPEVTVSALQWPRFMMTVVLRTSTHPLSLVSAVRTQVSDLDKDLPIYDVQMMDDVLSAEIVSQRFNAGAVAGFAVLLAAVGIYGVMAYAVSQRTHEMGVRIALGAEPGNVLRLVLNQGLRLTLIGVGLGLAASIGLTRLMRGLLFGVKPSDPGTYVLVTATLLAVAVAACYMPARRARRVDPVVAQRYHCHPRVATPGPRASPISSTRDSSARYSAMQ